MKKIKGLDVLIDTKWSWDYKAQRIKSTIV